MALGRRLIAIMKTIMKSLCASVKSISLLSSALLWASVAAGVFFGWASWDLMLSRERILNSARSQAMSSAQLVARNMDNAVGRVDLILQQVIADNGQRMAAKCKDGKSRPDAAVSRYLARELAFIPESQSLRVSDPRGTFCFDARGILPKARVNDRQYVLQHRRHADSGLVISEPIFARVTHNWVVTVSRQLPRPVDGSFAGVLQAALNEDFLQALIKHDDHSGRSVITIIGKSGRMLTRWPPLPNAIGRDIHSPALALMQHGVVAGFYQRNSVIDHQPRIYGWAAGQRGLIALVGINEDEVLQPWWERLQTEALFCLLATLVWIAAFLSWRRKILDAQQHQHAAQFRAAALLDNLPEMAWFRSAGGEYLSINPALAHQAGCSVEPDSGLTDRDIWPQEVVAVVARLSDQALHKPGVSKAGIVLQQDGQPRYFEVSCVAAKSGDAVAGIARDTTEQKQRQKLLQNIADTDPLTLLPNRRVAEQLLSQLQGQTTLLFVDLDRFKTVNDTLGHKFGDRLLVEASRRLRQICNAEMVCTRQGGDEFLFVARNLEREAAARLAEQIQHLLSQPYQLESAEICLSASIGIALYPQDADNGNDLLMAADSAMYAAKASGRQMACFYSAKMGQDAFEKMAMEAQLHRALSLGQIQLHYQPQLTPYGQVKGYEALMRWTHPTLGQVPPSCFIPLAEECGLIHSLGAWALQEAARVCATLRAAGLSARISVNVSASQLNATPLAAAVQAAVSAAGACLDDFEIEVTESMLMQSPLQARAELAKIKALGVAVALDDFGTGFSSLGQLANLPISRIKMDRAFVTGLPDREDGAALAKTICDLGQRLKLPVVAEGVETASELEFLRQSGCDEIQGYYFARPMPLQDLLLWLRAAGQETPDEGLRYSLGADVTASL